MLTLSATYPEVLAETLPIYMHTPTYMRLNVNDLSLLGIHTNKR